MTLPSQYLRQSPKWEKYMNTLNWESFRIQDDVILFYKRLGFITIAKILHPRQLKEQDVNEIITFCKKNHVFFLKMEVRPDQDLSVLERKNFVSSLVPIGVTSTMYINLSLSEGDLWKNVTKSCRYSVNRARREGFTAEFYKNPSKEVVGQYFGEAKQTIHRKHLYMPNLQDHLKKIEIFGDESFIALVKDSSGEYVGGKMFFAHKECVWFFAGGMTEKGRTSKAGYLLMWESLINLKREGFTLFDFEGIQDDRFPMYTKNWGGFTYFKEKFGGEVVDFPYPQVYYTSPIIRFFSRFFYLQI